LIALVVLLFLWNGAMGVFENFSATMAAIEAAILPLYSSSRHNFFPIHLNGRI
jgi:hypothetical protein